MEKVENTFPRRAPRRRREGGGSRRKADGGKRGEAGRVGGGAGRGRGAPVLASASAPRSGERTRVNATTEAQSAAGVQRDHEGPEITVVVRSPVKRLLTWASVPARPPARRATCGSKVSGSTRPSFASLPPNRSSRFRFVWRRVRELTLLLNEGGGGGNKVDRIGERRRRIELIRSLGLEEAGIDKVTWYDEGILDLLLAVFLSRSSRLLVSCTTRCSISVRSDRRQWSTPVNKRAPFDTRVPAGKVEEKKWASCVQWTKLLRFNYVPSESSWIFHLRSVFRFYHKISWRENKDSLKFRLV